MQRLTRQETRARQGVNMEGSGGLSQLSRQDLLKTEQVSHDSNLEANTSYLKMLGVSRQCTTLEGRTDWRQLARAAPILSWMLIRLNQENLVTAA